MRLGPEAKRFIADTRKANSKQVREGAERACRPGKLSWSLVLVQGYTRAGQDAVKEAAMFLARCRSLPGATRSKLV
jgi:hypothetical protein